MTKITKLKTKTTLLGSLVAIPIAIAGSMIFAESASAAFTSALIQGSTDGINWTTLTQDSDGDGNLSYTNTNWNNWNLKLDATTKGTAGTGSASSPDIGFTTLDVTSNGGTIYLRFGDLGFTGPDLANFYSSLAGILAPKATVMLEAWLDNTSNANDPFGKEILLASISGTNSSSSAPKAILIDDVKFVDTNNPYSLSIWVKVVHTNIVGKTETSLTTGSVIAEAVPEPITLLGSGIALGFGGYLKRRLNQKQKA